MRNRVVANTEKMKESILKFEEKRLNDVKKHLQGRFSKSNILLYFRLDQILGFAITYTVQL